jgi:nucleotide-binding universal stress UspA family protein
MLSDVFVPLLTYPDPTPTAFAKGLTQFISRFAWTVTFSPVEIDIPNLANRWGAALTALPQMIAQVEANSRQAAENLARETNGAFGALAIRHHPVRAMLGSVSPTLLPYALNHDLTLVAAGGSDEKLSVAEGFIFGSGRPVMVVPEHDLSGFDLSEVAIAWDGSRCASRAVFDAMPLLTNASKVTLLLAHDKSISEASVEQLFAYLDRHGVRVERRDISLKGQGVGDALQDAALEAGSSLLVMGAYGHNRLKEFMLGGATKSVLDTPRLPILMSH